MVCLAALKPLTARTHQSPARFAPIEAKWKYQQNQLRKCWAKTTIAAAEKLLLCRHCDIVAGSQRQAGSQVAAALWFSLSLSKSSCLPSCFPGRAHTNYNFNLAKKVFRAYQTWFMPQMIATRWKTSMYTRMRLQVCVWVCVCGVCRVGVAVQFTCGKPKLKLEPSGTVKFVGQTRLTGQWTLAINTL